jgi:MFS superfamily sulfate permease-like transporter
MVIALGLILIIIICVVVAFLFDAKWPMIIGLSASLAYILRSLARQCVRKEHMTDVNDKDDGMDTPSNNKPLDKSIIPKMEEAYVYKTLDMDDGMAAKGQMLSSSPKRSKIIQAKKTVRTFDKYFKEELNNTEGLAWWDNAALDYEM